jgi:hypothetical protein
VDETRRRQEVHRREAEILAEIGRTARFQEVGVPRKGGLSGWFRPMPRHRQQVEVRMPEHLARAAIDAWQQGDPNEVVPESETPQERELRRRAWTLALLGSVVSERGRSDGSEVVVPLTRDIADEAIKAANEPLG